MGVSPQLWSYKNTSFHCRDWWGFYGWIVIVVLSLNSDLGRPHRLSQGSPHPFYRWRFQAVSWAPPLPLISYFLGRDIRLLSDNLHLLQAQREFWLCRLMGQVQQLLPAMELGQEKPRVTSQASPTTCKEMESKENRVSKDQPSSPTRRLQLQCKAFCPCFQTHLLDFNQTWSSQDGGCPWAVRKGAEWK